MGFIRKMHYKSKLILCYLVLVSFPLILCLSLLYQSIVKPVRDKAASANYQWLEQQLYAIDSKVEKIRNISYLLSTNTVINQFFVPRYYSDLDLIEILNNDISPLLSWVEASSPEISYYHFFTDNPSIPDAKYLHQYADFQSEPWMRKMKASLYEKGYYLEPCHPNRSYGYGSNGNGQMAYSLFYPLLSMGSYLEICVNPSVFFGDMGSIPTPKSGFTAASDSAGTLILAPPANVSASFGSFLRQLFAKGYDLAKEAPVKMTLDQADYFLFARKIPSLDTWLLCAVPCIQINGSVLKAQQSFALVLFAAALGIVLLSCLLSTLLIRKIHTITAAVQKIQKGDFNIAIPVNGEDEIEQLAAGVNNMSFKINDLINRVYKAQVLQKETELAAFQAQINPHFLFNILETFKMIAMIHDLDDFSDSIAALGNLMRYNISPSGRHCTLEHELRIIKDYVNIQNLLLNNRASLDLTAPNELLRFEMPNFILQPIIENSFVHGFEDKLDELMIKISIDWHGSWIIIKIEDNGKGISQKQRHALADAMKNSMEKLEIGSKFCQPQRNGSRQDGSSQNGKCQNGKSIGILNVNLRLFLLYGEHYSLTFASSALGGACVTLSLPISLPMKGQAETDINERSIL